MRPVSGACHPIQFQESCMIVMEHGLEGSIGSIDPWGPFDLESYLLDYYRASYRASIYIPKAVPARDPSR